MDISTEFCRLGESMDSSSDASVGWTLLTRYVAGSCSEEEEVRVETWAASDPQNRRLLEELRQVWELASRRGPALPVDVDVAWEQVRHQMDKKDISAERSSSGDAADRVVGSDRDRPSRPRSRTFQRRCRLGIAAAVMIVVAAVGVFMMEGIPDGGAAENEKVFTTERGQRAVIELTDGSRVRLNVDSRLVVLNGGFSDNQREVRLDGEAYFEVARDTSRPFQVHVEGASIRVLGTSFDVRAYTDEEPAEVTVAEGQVALLTEEETSSETSIQLQSQQMGIAGDEELKMYRDVDLSSRLAWTKGRLVFESAPLPEVVRKLERWYNLQIENRASPKSVDKLNATFDDESVSEVLDDIAIALNLRYEKEGKTVTFYRPSHSRSSTGEVRGLRGHSEASLDNILS